MRRFLLILLAFVIPFQAAFAATTALADSVEHAYLPDHHSHDPVHDHAVDHDSDDVLQHANDHHHSHAYPVFSPMPMALPDLSFPGATSVKPQSPGKPYASAPPSRLERPPRPFPVA